MKHVILAGVCAAHGLSAHLCVLQSVSHHGHLAAAGSRHARRSGGGMGGIERHAARSWRFTAAASRRSISRRRRRFWESAAQLKKDGRISRVRLSTRPDALGAEVLARLAHYGVDTVEIGVQSLDDEVLAASQRGHTAAQAEDAIRRVQAAGFRCGAQMMVALPGDTPGKKALPPEHGLCSWRRIWCASIQRR